LSELGESVLRSQRACDERLETPLQAVANDVATELNRRLAGAVTQVRIHASHGYAVATLVRALGDQRVPVDIKYRESAEAVSALARGECELAGFHLPIGPFRSTCAEIYRPYLDPKKHQLIRLTRRTQGLFLPKGNPKHIGGLRDLARDDVRFVNRQPGSGTRMLLDLSLRSVGVDPDQINGYATTELTHSAIAAFVASGMADLGFGVQPAAQHFALDFIPIVDEDYFFACERARLDEARFASVLRILRSASFTDSVAHLDGYDPTHCGAVVDVDTGLNGLNA
jgi:molybdate-binding protein